MIYRNLKIGYVPYLNDMSQPGNRRRFPYFAKRKNIKFEIANPKADYDIVLLVGQANISEWILYKRKHPQTKFIFEMTDSVIFTSDIFRTVFKGIGRFILRRETVLYFNYKKPVEKWLEMADVVICSSREVKESIKHFNKNIIISLDYLESEYRFLKKDYTTGQSLKLVWEGLGVTLHHLLTFKELFKELSSFCELHVITSQKFPGWGNLTNKRVHAILKQLPIKTVFHEWDINTKDQILSACDLGIIPLNKKNLFAWHKPANKLISFWFTGLPAIVSNTPAYMDIMQATNHTYYCGPTSEWIRKIKEFNELSEAESRSIAEKNHEYVQTHCSDAVLDEVWMEILNKVVK